MEKNHLNRVANITTPILSLFSITLPGLLMQEKEILLLMLPIFIGGMAIIYLFWQVNIYFVLSSQSKGHKAGWPFFFKSYVFLFIVIIFSVLLFYFINLDQYLLPAIIITLINGTGINTMIVFLIGITYYQNRHSREKRELSEIKSKKSEIEQQQLVLQLQPHFLFNALSTLRSLIKSNAEIAEEYVDRLSDFLRIIITQKKNLILLQDEVQFVIDYVELQSIRFDKNIVYSINIPDGELTNYLIPVYALQIFVENAIKHNIFTDKHQLKIEICFEDGYLKVSNNKRLKKSVQSNGVGLKNLNDRYQFFCGEGINICDVEDKFTVEIKLIRK